MKKLFILLICCALAGCFAGRSQPSTFYTLETLSSQQTNGQFSKTIAVMDVQLPKYLDRPQMVTAAPNGQVIVSENNRWVEPLSNLMKRILASDLSNSFSKGIVKQKTLSNEKFDYLLTVDISEMTIFLGDKITMKGWWVLRQPDGKVVLREKIDLSEPVANDYADLAKKQSTLLFNLSQQIQKKLKG